MPQKQVSGHKLGLWGRVRDTGLPFADSRYREASIRSPNGEVVTGGASLCRCTSGEIGISKEVWLQRAQFVTDPSNHSEMLRRVNITHKSMKLAVTLGRPFGDKSRQMTNGTQQVETTVGPRRGSSSRPWRQSAEDDQHQGQKGASPQVPENPELA